MYNKILRRIILTPYLRLPYLETYSGHMFWRAASLHGFRGLYLFIYLETCSGGRPVSMASKASIFLYTWKHVLMGGQSPWLQRPLSIYIPGNMFWWAARLHGFRGLYLQVNLLITYVRPKLNT